MVSKPLRVLMFVFSAFVVLAFTAGVTHAANQYLFGRASGSTADPVRAVLEGTADPTMTAEPSATPDPSATPEPSQTPEPTQPGQEEIDFSGVITAIELEWWTIGEFVVQVTADTEFEGDPVVGDTVEVEAFLQADGSYIAHEISLEDDLMDEEEEEEEGDDDDGEHMTGTPKAEDHEEHATGTPEVHDDDDDDEHEEDELSEDDDEHGGGDHDGGGDHGGGGDDDGDD